jgi:putative transposase
VPRRYTPEFRRKVLDLLKAGRPVVDLARDLQISDQSIYNWRRQDLIDTGQLPGVSSTDQAELVAARRRIAELETELAIHRRAAELLKEAVPPKGRYAVIATMAAEGLPVEVCCRVLAVSASGYYAWRNRPPSARSLRHAWLSEQIRAVHLASRSTYGSRRVHAELRLGRGIVVGYHAVEMLMRRAGIKGLPGSRRPRPRHETSTPGDLVNRNFTRAAPNLLWVTDITEHPTREGKVYCAVVLDTFSAKSWAGPSTPPRLPPWSPTRCRWRSIIDNRPGRSSIPITACNSGLGSSPVASKRLAWRRRWVRSGTATTTA